MKVRESTASVKFAVLRVAWHGPVMSLTYPPARPSGTSYLFIDGENLNQTLQKLSRKYFSDEKLFVNWAALRGNGKKAFYYDAISVKNEGEDDNTYSQRVGPKRAELEKIEQQDNYHVRSGDVRHRKRRGNEQKMVDVQLAVDALLMASRGLFSGITLLTGDLDFRPLVTALVEMGVDVKLLYPPGETNVELIAAADRAVPLNIGMAANPSYSAR